MEEIIKMLKILNKISPMDRWTLVRKLVDEIDNIEVLDKKWYDSFKQNHLDMYPLDLTTIKTWSTFQNCVELHFNLIDDDWLKCSAVIYDGDNFYGNKQSKRFYAELKVPISFIKYIERDITHEFSRHLGRLHDTYLSEQRANWIQDCATKLLKDD